MTRRKQYERDDEARYNSMADAVSLCNPIAYARHSRDHPIKLPACLDRRQAVELIESIYGSGD